MEQRDVNVTMVTLETDLSRTQLPAYELDINGNVRLGPEPVDEAYSEAHEVWVLSVNERVGSTSSALAAVQTQEKGIATPYKRRLSGPVAQTTKSIACNPTGIRNNNGLEHLLKFKIPDPSKVEHWTAGKLEPRVIVVGKGGVEIGNFYFGKIKRKNVRNWYGTDLRLTTWDRVLLGDYFAYKWIEEDYGPKIELSLGLSYAIKEKLSVTADVKATFESKHDDMGANLVNFNESTYLEYATGVVRWMVCSVGGDGHTGNDNLALAATASASSTYPFLGYSAARVNDGSQSTASSGAASWRNFSSLPQWVQLDFGTNKTFTRMVLYTTSGYPIQEYRFQYFDSLLGWRDVFPQVWVTGNTDLSRTHTFSAVTARLVRILAIRGPNHQPGTVRINEFEVYP